MDFRKVFSELKYYFLSTKDFYFSANKKLVISYVVLSCIFVSLLAIQNIYTGAALLVYLGVAVPSIVKKINNG